MSRLVVGKVPWGILAPSGSRWGLHPRPHIPQHPASSAAPGALGQWVLHRAAAGAGAGTGAGTGG